MSLLHSSPSLEPAELSGALTDADAHLASDRVRLYPHIMPSSEASHG
jgi:hypothetical protein